MGNSPHTKCYCPVCGQVTNHAVLFSAKEHSDDDDYWWESTYSVVKCLGCESIQFHKEDIDESNFEYYGDGDIDTHPTINYDILGNDIKWNLLEIHGSCLNLSEDYMSRQWIA